MPNNKCSSFEIVAYVTGKQLENSKNQIIQNSNKQTKNKFAVGLCSSTISELSVLWTNDATNDANW